MTDWNETLGALGKIIISDLVLSGDNALVIGLAVQRLPEELKKRAIGYGTLGAILLRVLFTLAASFVLRVPLLKAVGGIMLLWIGYKLLAENDKTPHTDLHAKNNFSDAVRTIIIADAIMSLDNAIAVAGAAKENIVLLLVGLGLSIPLLMVGSNVISGLFSRHQWLVYLGAAMIAYVGAELIHSDKLLRSWLPFMEQNWVFWLLVITSVLGVILLGRMGQHADDKMEKA